MAIEFGVSTLRAIMDGIETGCAVNGSPASASVAVGGVWIGGKYCVVTGSDITIANGAGVNTGMVMIYAYIPAGNSSTANVTFCTAASPTYLNRRSPGTAIAPLAIGMFTGHFATSTEDANRTSGLTGSRPFGRALNCSIDVSYDQAIARGGTLVFGTDLKLYNGSIEGKLEYATISGANLARMLGSTWVSGGAGSGTMTLSATETPLPFMIETQQITNGVTSTVRILKCYSNELSLALDREDYTMPSLSFVAVGNQEGDVMTWNI